MISNTPFRAGPRLARVFVALSVGVLALSSAADEPLQLGNEHLGMTSEGMTRASNASRDEERVAAELAKNEWRTEDSNEPSLQAGATGPAAANYEDCVELAIRAGNGFRAASGVCLALFPGAYPSQDHSAPLSRAASPDDEPLVLTLPPSTRVAEPSEPEGAVDPWEAGAEQAPDGAVGAAGDEPDAVEETGQEEPAESSGEAASSEPEGAGEAGVEEGGAEAESAAPAAESSAEAAPETPAGD